MKSLASVNKYFYKYRVRLLLGTLFVILSGWFSVFSTPYIGKGIDYAIKTATTFPNHPPSNALYHLMFYIMVILGMGLVSGIFLFLTRQTIIVMSRLIEYDQKNEIFNHYQKLDLAFYKMNNTGDLMNRISEDVSRVRMYYGPAVMYTINTITMIGLTLFAMLTTNVRFTLYVLIPMPLLYFAIYYISALINKKSTLVQQQLSVLFSKAQETFSGIRVIKSYRLEKHLALDFDEACVDFRKKNMELVKIDSLFQPAIICLVGLSPIIIIFIGGKEALKGLISPGDIISYMIYVNKLTMPVASLGWITSMVQRAAASQTRIDEFLHTKPSIEDKNTVETLIEGTIEFKNVSFVYPDSGIKALDNLSFRLNKHESLGIVGKTGSGKTTIAQLICRTYDVTTGSIAIDGKDIRNLPLASLRNHIGYVPQEVFLFSDTIANNIGFSQSDSYRKDNETMNPAIMQAAKDAAIYDNIMEFKDDFKTFVGERGITLSGGQKQRISIARALLKAPGILIFDDCLSAVDTNTEQEILMSIGKIMQGRTTIIISHRISSVKMCDTILVLDKGKIAEFGVHEELIRQHGLYREIYDLQSSKESSALYIADSQ
jgi:ATP-binding cassette subfamily B protein